MTRITQVWIGLLLLTGATVLLAELAPPRAVLVPGALILAYCKALLILGEYLLLRQAPGWFLGARRGLAGVMVLFAVLALAG